MSFELQDLTAAEYCERCWARLKEVMRNGKASEIRAAFDAAYHADQEEAQASVRIRPAAKRGTDPLIPPKRGAQE